MQFKEKLTSINIKHAVAPIALVGSIILSGCGSKPEPIVPKDPQRSISKGDPEFAPEPNTRFYDNGTFDTHLGFERIKSWCQGNDLRELVEGDREPSISRSTNHPACDDGKATQADFELPRPTTSLAPR